MDKLSSLMLALGCSLAFASHADNCRYTRDATANVTGPGIARVVIEAGAGDLAVRGTRGNEVAARGRSCASSEELLGQIRLDSRREGDTVYLKTVLPEALQFGWNRYAHLDLTVSVPGSAIVSVTDGSGELQVGNVRSATIVDGSGDQHVHDVAGDLNVKDSSGDLRIENVSGNLELQDSSGDVTVNDVRGDVLVGLDSSGDLNIAQVTGSAHVINDSSGDIEIEDVRRDVTIDRDSSGSIHVQRVGGNFTVDHDGSGNIVHHDVAGSVRVPD